MPRTRHQVNITLSPEQFELIKGAAEAEELTMARFVRNAALDAAQPLENPDMRANFPGWVIALLAFLRTRPTQHDSRNGRSAQDRRSQPEPSRIDMLKLVAGTGGGDSWKLMVAGLA